MDRAPGEDRGVGQRAAPGGDGVRHAARQAAPHAVEHDGTELPRACLAGRTWCAALRRPRPAGGSRGGRRESAFFFARSARSMLRGCTEMPKLLTARQRAAPGRAVARALLLDKAITSGVSLCAPSARGCRGRSPLRPSRAKAASAW